MTIARRVVEPGTIVDVGDATSDHVEGVGGGADPREVRAIDADPVLEFAAENFLR